MKVSQAGRTMVLILSLAAIPAFATRTEHAATPGHAHASIKHVLSKHRLVHGHRAAKPKGQRQIDPERATQIQSALIRENYMTGTPSGQWDANTEEAMQKYQEDHGWQTKLTPDSRALIKLGLGPNQNGPAPAAISATETASRPVANTNETDTLASAHAIQQ
jgi:hypothetical protein